MLNDSEQAQKLLQAMDDALAMLPLDFESVNETYEKKLQLLTEVHQYVEGSYTIFPAQEVAEQTEGLTGYQMSLFDIMSNSELEEITEEPEVEVEEIQNEEPEADPHMSFEEAKELWEDGFYEDDYVLKSRVGELIYDSMDTVGKSVEDFYRGTDGGYPKVG